MEYLHILKQALVYTLTAYWCYQTVISLCALVKLKDKPLLTNNLFSDSPFGIPHYANAIDVMKTVDIDFDAFKNEVKDGRRRIFARATFPTFLPPQDTKLPPGFK